MKPENLGVKLYIISDIYLMFLSRDIVPLGECKRGFFRLGKTYCVLYSVYAVHCTEKGPHQSKNCMIQTSTTNTVQCICSSLHCPVTLPSEESIHSFYATNLAWQDHREGPSEKKKYCVENRTLRSKVPSIHFRGGAPRIKNQVLQNI